MNTLEMPWSAGKLTANSLKLIAIAAMLIDHIAWAFVSTATPLGFGMHLIGRMTMPIMCYFIAEGYHYTRSVPNYALRLGGFTLLSYLPFIFFETGSLPDAQSFLNLNVIYTLLIGLLALWVQDAAPNKAIRILCTVGLCLIATLGDWGFWGVLFILAFGLNRGNFKKQAFWFSMVSACLVLSIALPDLLILVYGAFHDPHTLCTAGIISVVPTVNEVLCCTGMQFGLFLALPVLRLYNGKKGRGGKVSQWLFYIFYPVHLMILGLLRLWL